MGLQQADAADAGFGARVKKAIFWRSGSQIISQILSWVVTLAVIRLLDPKDYGLFAMTQVILNFATFLNGYGLVAALVQSEDLESHRLRQAFTIMLLLNGSLALLQLAIAPLAADYYNQPMVAQLLRVQALLYLSTPFIAIPEAITARALDFRRPAFINLIAAIASAAMALVGALSGWGVWTLVFAPMTGFWVKALGYMLVTGFRPIPSFDFTGTRAMILYGASLLGSQLFWIIQSQSDIFIGGRVLTPHQLGLYAEALFLTQIFVSKFIPPLNEVAFPAYARMQKDVSRVAWSFCKAVRLLMLISCPIYLGMAVTAEPLVETLFGQKWLTLQVMFAPVSNALGRPGTTARIAAIGAILMATAFLIGIQWGAIGLAWAWLGAFPILTIVTARLAGGPMGLRAIDLIRAAAPGLGCAILMAGVVLVIDRLLPPLAAPIRLAILVPAGGIAFLAALMLCARGTLMELVRLIVRRAPPVQARA
ncbi:MAG: lipopolysaccharide biosynthesis protein [Sphingobium sp.]|nr:MAG: lipopolysaccharide biosynthesis protein [Sphingobium sp.]